MYYSVTAVSAFADFILFPHWNDYTLWFNADQHWRWLSILITIYLSNIAQLYRMYVVSSLAKPELIQAQQLSEEALSLPFEL